MTTWEDILGNHVGLADKFFCATCLNRIFRGSTGHWGQRIVLKKQPVPGNLIDEDTGRPVTFQCPDCTDREPIVLPQVHPNGELVNHINISELKDVEGEQKSSFGDYDNREQQKAMNQQSVKDHEAEQLSIQQKERLPDDVAQRIAEQIEDEQVVNESKEYDKKEDDTSHKEDRQETHS